tara:strand:- start:706 stop:1293 length:588 start_codon:yes stop_codon:yes gene_type:complete
MLNKKGAMFGLDARIALAIFGALSVISGAALYSAIKESRITSLLTEYNEIGKAWESFYLDTGVQLAKASGYHNRFYTGQLVTDDSIDGWKGPYIAFEDKGGAFRPLIHERYYTILALYANSTDWDFFGDVSTICTATDCYLWILIDGLTLDLVEGLDKKIDNSDGADKGKLRYDYDSHVDVQYRASYQYAPIKMP